MKGAGGGRAAAARVKLWDLATEKELAAFPWGRRPGVTSVAFSADSKTLAAGGDHLVRLWDVSASRPAR
jgi:WD40 repeat protein